MSGRFSPHRSFRSELLSLALAVAVPALLLTAFPLAALRPPPSVSAAADEALCSFVTLTPDEERKIIASARAAWQLDHGAARRMRIDLLAAALPEMAPRMVLDDSSRPRVDRSAPAPYVPDLLPPTLAAPPPATIAPEPDADVVAPTFPRKELLELR